MNISNQSNWKTRIIKSVENSIQKHEKRLMNVRVNLELKEEEVASNSTSVVNVKKGVKISVTANISDTNEPFTFIQKMFLSPLSFE